MSTRSPPQNGENKVVSEDLPSSGSSDAEDDEDMMDLVPSTDTANPGDPKDTGRDYQKIPFDRMSKEHDIHVLPVTTRDIRSHPDTLILYMEKPEESEVLDDVLDLVREITMVTTAGWIEKHRVRLTQSRFHTEDVRRAYRAKYQLKPEYIEKRKKALLDPEVKEKKRLYNARPDVRQRKREAAKIKTQLYKIAKRSGQLDSLRGGKMVADSLTIVPVNVQSRRQKA